MFDFITIAVSSNSMKNALFTLDERVHLIQKSIKNDKRIFVDSFNGLLVDYVEGKKTNIILRGMRALSDFEYEFQLALINRRLNRKMETVFLMTGARWFYCNSGIVKEAAGLGGSVKGMVPDIVLKKLKEKFPDMNGNNPEI